MKKYNRLKQFYEEKEFDTKDFIIPKDFPKDIPEKAYYDYIKLFHNGDNSLWDLEDFNDRYFGEFPFDDPSSTENLVKKYYNTMVGASPSYYAENILRSINLSDLGLDLCFKYKILTDKDISQFKSPPEINKNLFGIEDNNKTLKNKVIEFLKEEAPLDVYSRDFDLIGLGYLETLSELTNTPIWGVIFKTQDMNSIIYLDYGEEVERLVGYGGILISEDDDIFPSDSVFLKYK